MSQGLFSQTFCTVSSTFFSNMKTKIRKINSAQSLAKKNRSKEPTPKYTIAISNRTISYHAVLGLFVTRLDRNVETRLQ